MRLTTLGISLNPINSSLNSEGPQQYVKIFNSSIGILKTTVGISILIANCFTIYSNTTYIELENSTLNMSNSVFHDVANNRTKYPALAFAWGNSKVTVQDTIIQPFEVLAVIINHSELRMKNVSFKGCSEWPVNDKTVIVSYNSSVIDMDTCSFTNVTPDSVKRHLRNWTFATLNGNSFSNKCHRKSVYPVYENYVYFNDTFIACTLTGAAAGVVSYFEDSMVAIYNTSFHGNRNTQVSVWVAKHSKLFAQNLSCDGLFGILGTESQIEVSKYHGWDKRRGAIILAAQHSNVSVKDYQITRSVQSGLISFVNSYGTIENSVFTNIERLYGSAIFARGSTLFIENSTFSGNKAMDELYDFLYFDMYLTNSTLIGINLQLGGIMITNFSFFNMTNSEVYASRNLNVYVAYNSTAHFASTMFLSGKPYFGHLRTYDPFSSVSFLFPSVFFTCNSSSIILEDCNFLNTTQFRIYLFSSITFLNTTFENNAGVYEVADNSYLQFDGCSLLAGAERVFANKGAVVSIKNSDIAYGRSQFTLLNKSLLSLLMTNIYDNIFGNFIVSQLQSTIIISNCLYSNNSRIEKNNTTEVHSPLSHKMIKSMAAAINDTSAFINISSSTISVQDSTLSGNIGSLIVTSVSNVTFNNCIIENNTAMSKPINFMEFISSNVHIEHCLFFNNNNTLFVNDIHKPLIPEYRGLIFMRSELKEPGNFVSLEYSRFNNNGFIILKDVLDTCIESCNFSNNYFQMESSSTVDVLKKMFVLRISASNFSSAHADEFPFLIFKRGTSPGLNLFSSAILNDVLFKIFTYQQKGLKFSKGSVSTSSREAILDHEEHAYASGKFPRVTNFHIIYGSKR